MRKILIIDDMNIILLRVKDILESLIPDSQVYMAISGDAGLKIAKKEQPDTILLDICMPEMDGYEVCKRLKADDSTRHIPIIILTATETDLNSRVKSLDTGADAFLAKPFSPIELTAQVKVMLRIKKAEDILRSEKVDLEELVENRTKKLKEAMEKATESDRLKSAFLATMSHELRTPLNAIIGFSQLLDKETTGEIVEKFAKRILLGGENLLNIIESIFDFTLVESGEMQNIKEEKNLRTLLDTLLVIGNSEKEKLNKAGVDIRISPENMNRDHHIITDHKLVERIFIILLKNAVKFTEEGVIEFGFQKIEKSGQQFLQFYIKDTGIGVPEEKQCIIFDIFRQAEESYTRKYGGTGIGLSIAKKIAECLESEIGVESQEGKGSRFYFAIPHEESSKTVGPVISKVNDEQGLSGKTVLIVEDDKSNYDFLVKFLEKADLRHIWARNGEEAVQQCRENSNIDLVLMDINLPLMNGYMATKKIKEFRSDLPIIALTAYGLSGDMEKALAAGCDDYLSKPIIRAVLLSKIAQHITNLINVR